ncbi:MAG: NifU N-terminal domain-containing protein [Chloroflexi bacterium]|nr:NifU N-terminal domain-containing protein [Chloroflexota bacterium]
MPVQITVEPTPNPLAMKFTLDRPVVEGRSQSYDSPQAAERSPLAKKLFAVRGVVGVFMAANFITVRKDSDVEWEEIAPRVEAAVKAHFG